MKNEIIMTQYINHDQMFEKYNTFLIDQWGVLHNGYDVYDGVHDFFAKARALNKTIILLSNSASPADKNIAHCKRLGIPENYYDLFMSSGEAVRHGFMNRYAPFDSFGCDVYVMISEARTDIMLDDLAVKHVHDLEEASCILLHSIDFRIFLDDLNYKEFLSRAMSLNLPVICSNPDIYALVGDEMQPQAGMIARDYKAIGGTVHYFGKPHANVYRLSQSMMDFDVNETLMIGDSLHHDILGGNNFGMDTLLIGNGLLSADLKTLNDDNKLQYVNDYAQKEDIKPTYFRMGL